MGSKNLDIISNTYSVKTDDIKSLVTPQRFIQSQENDYSRIRQSLRRIKGTDGYDEDRNLVRDKPINVDDFFYQIKSPNQAVLDYRIKSKNLNRFISLSKWEGNVEYIFGENVTALVHDLNNPGVSEYVEFSIDEINQEDRSLLEIGAIFYWNVGYEEISGTRKKVSYIRFRRLPKLARNELARIKKEAQDLRKQINWDE